MPREAPVTRATRFSFATVRPIVAAPRSPLVGRRRRAAGVRWRPGRAQHERAHHERAAWTTPFPYGAVYFRKSNPPPEDWARDYRTGRGGRDEPSSATGSSGRRSRWRPGEFDWADYDRQLDLAAGNGMTTVIAEMLTAAPEWAWRRFAHARYEDAQRARWPTASTAPAAPPGASPACAWTTRTRCSSPGAS